MVLSIALFEIAQCHMQTNGKKNLKKMSPKKRSTKVTLICVIPVLHECIRSFAIDFIAIRVESEKLR